MDVVASQITSLTIVYSTVYLGADQRKHQSSASLAFVRGIHRGPVNSPHKWPVTRKMFSSDDVIIGVDGDDGMWLMVSLVVLVFHVGVFGSSGGIGDMCSICCRHRAFVQTRNAPIPYPTVHHFLTEMCTGVHISVTKCCIVWYFSDALWDLWHGFIILGHIIFKVNGKRVASRFCDLFH